LEWNETLSPTNRGLQFQFCLCFCAPRFLCNIYGTANISTSTLFLSLTNHMAREGNWSLWLQRQFILV
jgi:hypothetical protein